MKKRILVIMPDKLKQPVGGLGIQFQELSSRLAHRYEFDILAHPEDNGLSNYHGVFSELPGIGHHSLSTIAGQISYFYAATQVAKPDIVHGYDWSTYFAAVSAARYWKVPLVVTMQLSVNLL